MTPLFNVIKSTAPVWVGLVEIDSDSRAERIAIANRLDFSLIKHTLAQPLLRALVPVEYCTGNDLMVLILDDAGDPLHYVTGNDKVQAELVDARTVTLNP